MYISPTALIVSATLLSEVANAYPNPQAQVAPGPKVHGSFASSTSTAPSSTATATRKAEIPFYEYYMKVYGDGKYTAIATAEPTEYESDLERRAMPEVAVEPAVEPAVEQAVSNTTVASNSTDSTETALTDLFADSEAAEAIEDSLRTSITQYGVINQTALDTVPVTEQPILDHLIYMWGQFQGEGGDEALYVMELVLQELVHGRHDEAIKKIEAVLETGFEDIKKVDEEVYRDKYTINLMQAWSKILAGESTFAEMEEDDDEDLRGNDPSQDKSHKLDSRSPKKKKNKNASPKTCPSGSQVPGRGYRDCPDLKQWQKAQEQDRELRRHLKKKEKADMKRDHKRIASTTFAALACALLPMRHWICPLLAAPGVI